MISRFIGYSFVTILGFAPLMSCSVVFSGLTKSTPQIAAGTARDEVRQRLGRPRHSLDFDPPRPLGRVPVFQGRTDLPEGVSKRVVASQDEFLVRGVDRPRGGDVSTGDVSMMYGGLAEPILGPLAATEMVGSHLTIRRLVVWYDSRGTSVYAWLWEPEPGQPPPTTLEAHRPALGFDSLRPR